MSGTWIFLPPTGGSSQYFGDPVADVGALPVSGATGEVIYVLAENAFYAWDGAAWQPVSLGAGTIDINTQTTGTLLATRGGTGSAGPLTNNRVMVSTAGTIVESTITTTELTYLDNVTSDLQAQLNSKLNLSGGTLTGPLVFPSYTTVQRDLLTPAEGMVIFNTDQSRFQGYFAAAWSNLHGWGY